MNKITIVMYHYVRELSLTRFPNIKGLKVSDFKKQLDFLRANFNFITIQDCINAIYSTSAKLPKNPVLLTFDDGYAEHFMEVFPLLDARGIQGVFFPPAQAIMEHKVLDVNKIHFILASTDQPEKLVKTVNSQLLELAKDYNLEKPRYYLNKLENSKHRYDSPEVVYIKRLLQRELPEEPRKIILDALFSEYVGISEKTFAKELYMNEEQIKCMIQHGMFFGGHGYAHIWLDRISLKEQTDEIEKTMKFLENLGVDMNQWVMCYPYGAHNRQLIDLLKRKRCRLGLTTEEGAAGLENQNAFTLERFDTNDIQRLMEGKPNVISDDTFAL